MRDDIIALQLKIGASPDGFWGPKSIAATQKHLRRLMPAVNPWPKTDEKSLAEFYGAPGDENQLVALNVEGLGIGYDGKPVTAMRCHKRVAASLKRVLTEISKGRHAKLLKHYAGCYNHRPMRGGTRPSLHARGAAIDIDPETNGLVTHWPMKATMPLEVMEAFAREGWLPAGAFWSRDAMHFQATQ